MKGDQQTSRALNRRLVLNLLRRHGCLSRADLASETGLSAATMSFVVAELLEEGLVREREAVRGAGGRRPVPVEINYGGRLVIGVKLSPKGVEGVLTDLSTAPLRTEFEPIPDTRPETVVAHAAILARRLIAELPADAPPLIGIGLALPGTYDVERGICTVLARFGWRNVPIAEMLAREVAMPVWVDNDVNAFALAQHLLGAGKSHDMLLAVAVGDGIGAALMSDQHLHRGASGAAGEIGHSILVPGGRACECGRKGCLQTYWSEAALNADWAAHCEDLPDAPEDLALAAEAGDPAALALLNAAGEGLGQHLAIIVNMVDPDIIIVGGEGTRFGDHLREPLSRTLDTLAFESRPEVIFTWERDAWPRGGAALAVQRFFNFASRDGMITFSQAS